MMRVPCCPVEPALPMRAPETVYVPPAARDDDAVRAVVAAACRARWGAITVLGVRLHRELP